jgi:lipoprotein-anchoring transpeptidase ErfK/SrfK
MRLRSRRTVAGLAAAATVTALAASAAALRPAPERPARAARALTLPAPVAPAFVPGAPKPLGSRRHLSAWAPVRRRATARTAPTPRARAIAVVDTRTPEGTDNTVSVLRRRRDGAGRTWVLARLPVLPTGAVGWLPRDALGGYTTVSSLLDVDLTTLTLTLYRDGRQALHAPVGVGAPGWDTPRGTFYIRNKLTRYESPQYGPVAFGTSARSAHATDWPAGGFVGIHGTDRPDLLPGRVSHGCIRMRNADVLALDRLMPVGTPVRVH